MKTMLISGDVEADGSCPGIYSMVSFGMVVVEPSLSKTFYGETAPITNDWIPEALAVSGWSREEHLKFEIPEITMMKALSWVEKVSIGCRPVFIADNPAFDWQFMNYYFHKFCGHNPFGFSARRIGDIYAGLNKDLAFSNWKKFRITKHSHDPLADAMGNAEAILKLKEFDVKNIY